MQAKASDHRGRGRAGGTDSNWARADEAQGPEKGQSAGARGRRPSGKRSVTEQARRAQIVTAAIAVIAEGGYGQASFARIAERAGLSSTGLISYHFANRGELMEQVAARVIAEITEFMGERMAGATGAADALRRYIDGNVAFVETHRAEMKALLEIFLGGAFDYDAGQDRAAKSPVEDILRAGQASGEFRNFDVTVMATMIQRAVDGLPFLLTDDPDFDTRTYAREVITAFDLATRAAP